MDRLKILKGLIALFVLVIIIVVIILVVKCKEENFENQISGQPWTFNPIPPAGVGPFTPDAGTTAWFRTFGRECDPGLTKCVGANEQYFCSKRKDCKLKGYNLKGKPLHEPMSWFMRHI